MKLVAISIISWLAGLVSYVAALDLLWHQSLRGGDLRAVLYGSAVASVVGIGVLYAPAMFALKGWLASPPAWWPFPLLSVALGVFPVMVLIAVFGGSLRSVATPEAILFYSMFAVFGLVFGLGFFLSYGRRSV